MGRFAMEEVLREVPAQERPGAITQKDGQQCKGAVGGCSCYGTRPD